MDSYPGSQQIIPYIKFIALVLVSALCLHFSSLQPILLVFFLAIYGYLIVETYNSKCFFYLLLLSVLTAEILALRYDYLVWGDPWFEYFSVGTILSFHTILDPNIYWAQLPTMHLTIATVSLFSGIDPLIVQKFGVPLLSVIGIVAFYFIGEMYFEKRVAFLGSLFLIVSTVYLHWVDQAVRESLGIAFLLLALYVSLLAVSRRKYSYLIISFSLIFGLTLLHHLSSAFFLIIWCALSLTSLYFISDEKSRLWDAVTSLSIAVFSFSVIVLWWWLRIPAEYQLLDGMVNKIIPTPFGYGAIIITIIALYLFPVYIKNSSTLCRNFLNIVVVRKNAVFYGIVLITVIGALVVINFISGRSFYTLNYPWTMFVPGLIIFCFFMIGLFYNFDSQKIPIFSWILIVGLILIVSILNLVRFPDPLRILEFLAPPCILIAASGFCLITEKIHISKIAAILVAAFMVVSVVTSFPSDVLLGNTFYPGHPMYDQRNLVISHPQQEIISIKWLSENPVFPDYSTIESDTYTGYVIRGFVVRYDVILNNYARFPSKSDQFCGASENHHYYSVVSARMYKYAEFGSEWMASNKIPLNESDEKNLEMTRSTIYNNGGSKIFFC